MIQSFEDQAISDFFFNESVPKRAGWVSIKKIVRRKLAAVDAANSISDLKSPPGNSLERLKDDLAGYWSIRINDQWRIVFKWPEGAVGPSDISVVDYHRG